MRHSALDLDGWTELAAGKTLGRTWMVKPTRLAPLLIAVMLLAGCDGNDGNTAQASSTGDGMTAATTELWIAAVEAGDPEGISSLYSDDAVWIDTADDARFDGQVGVSVGWDIFSLVDEIGTVESVAITDDVAVVQWTFAGERLSGEEVPLDGEPWEPWEPWELTGLSVLEMTDGVVTAETLFYDAAHGPFPPNLGD